MRKVILSRLILAVVISALLVISFVPVDTAFAGSNGQQLVFYRYSNGSYISWLQVSGTNQYGSRVTWSRSFSPAVPNHSLANWWWKGYTTVSWRLANGRTGSCSFYVPVSQPSNWNQVGVDRQPGNTCWFS